jgi:hypothetical protein
MAGQREGVDRYLQDRLKACRTTTTAKHRTSSFCSAPETWNATGARKHVPRTVYGIPSSLDGVAVRARIERRTTADPRSGPRS